MIKYEYKINNWRYSIEIFTNGYNENILLVFKNGWTAFMEDAEIVLNGGTPKYSDRLAPFSDLPEEIQKWVIHILKLKTFM